VDSCGQTIWIVDAHRDDGKRFIVRADEKLTAFLELEAATGRAIISSEVLRSRLSPNQSIDKRVELPHAWHSNGVSETERSPKRKQ
jgi:hypothetical protein